MGERGLTLVVERPGVVTADLNAEDAEGFLDRVRAANALGRIGTVSEIGDVLVFLLSDAARYVTGTTIVADGGFLAVKRV